MITADPGDVGAATKDLGWGRILVTSTSDLKVGVRGQVLSLGDKSGDFPVYVVQLHLLQDEVWRWKLPILFAIKFIKPVYQK